MAHPGRFGAYLCVLLFLGTPLQGFADSGSFQHITTSRDIQQPFWLIEHPGAVASLILFAGGGGALQITDSGIGKAKNFLVRSRDMFADYGFNVVVIDKPGDKGDLYGFRTSEGHARDVQAVMAYLRQKYHTPVWLIGASRGSLSAANAAARLQGQDGPDGIVLTSSVVVTKRHESLRDVTLEDIRVATLFVHNKDDGCQVCPFSEVAGVMDKLSQAKETALQVHSGGRSKNGNPCNAMSPHGFLGLEEAVMRDIARWIKQRLK